MAPPPVRELLPGEQIVAQHEGVTLTNYRIVQYVADVGAARYMSITLDAVASSRIAAQSRPWLVLAALLAAATGAWAFLKEKTSISIGAGVAAVVLLAVYLATRHLVLSVRSSGGDTLTAELDPAGRAGAIAFLDAVDQEKLVALGRLAPMESAQAAR